MRAEDPKPMNSRPKRPFSPTVLAVIDDFLPIIKKWDTGKYAISIGGSQGKGTWDSHSDIDFRLFHEKNLPWTDVNPEMWVDYFAALERWKGKGVFVDGVWTRRIDVIDKALDRWLETAPGPLPAEAKKSGAREALVLPTLLAKRLPLRQQGKAQ